MSKSLHKNSDKTLKQHAVLRPSEYGVRDREELLNEVTAPWASRCAAPTRNYVGSLEAELLERIRSARSGWSKTKLGICYKDNGPYMFILRRQPGGWNVERIGSELDPIDPKQLLCTKLDEIPVIFPKLGLAAFAVESPDILGLTWRLDNHPSITTCSSAPATSEANYSSSLQ